jgi:hypothetical protein
MVQTSSLHSCQIRRFRIYCRKILSESFH